jgi:uncharacterized linocin/CFP29 family protein
LKDWKMKRMDQFPMPAVCGLKSTENGVSRHESAQRPQVELIECFALAWANLEKGHRLETSSAREFF